MTLQRKPPHMAGTMDSACPPGRSPAQRYLLFEGRDPSGRSPGALLTLLGGSHPGRPLGTGDYLLRILHRADPILTIHNYM